MQTEESGTVIEVREQTVLVRLRRSAACPGCAAAGQCHAGRDAGEQFLEARNEPGAVAGDSVRVAVTARTFFKAATKIYLLAFAGLLCGAAAAQLLSGALLPGPAAAGAAGGGGIAGAILGVLLGRRLAARSTAGAVPLPRITRIIAGVDAPPNRS